MRILVIISLLFVVACKSDMRDKFRDAPPTVNIEEELIKKQRIMLKQDSLIIANFITKNGWEMEQSGTGLRYEIYEKSEGELVNSGEQVFLTYVISDLKSDTLYTSDDSGVMHVVVDYSDAETGMHELLKLMRRGERARAIMPAHLAHGLVGDDYKIPPMTSLFFDIKVIK